MVCANVPQSQTSILVVQIDALGWVCGRGVVLSRDDVQCKWRGDTVSFAHFQNDDEPEPDKGKRQTSCLIG